MIKAVFISAFFLIVNLTVNSQVTEDPILNRISRYVGVETHKDTTMTHDPVMIREDGVYYMFATGWGITMFSSPDMIHWKHEYPIFTEVPEWIMEIVPDFRGHFWAPDVAYFNDQYYVYYSVSSFGRNTSAIGVVTNKTLNPDSPDYEWVDHGEVIRSIPGVTNWNAIDANIILGEDGTPFMSFGSFWGGLMLAELKPDGLSLAHPIEDLTLLATRTTGENPIEAPFIFKKDDYYYLFVSFDFCCRGEESTYKVVVGRSEKVEGEYFDKDGLSMLKGGGTIVVEGGDGYAGVGHNAVVAFDGVDYLVFHAYDMSRGGGSYLRILPIRWEDGWPEVDF
ncbi:family 43 glycosylhydrolase [Alkalitalea saponilacus]|uniref:Arabinan endo-1,5-alpha-L-arabinosidase n=1 Tax=Alkalitalea saponilacus TaxID=889453 RepID=A0A1T5ETT3_9BACT|nr:family 43 glycosylhydrolase [Alkalitalea saponilacus]SKB87199.1 arabinan endo-1,5-alpha-L-arabinosidase [Alkalitalea saponilacus]